MRHNFFDPLKEEDFYDDSVLFHMPIGEMKKSSKSNDVDASSLKTDITSIKDEQKSNLSLSTQTNVGNINEDICTSF